MVVDDSSKPYSSPQEVCDYLFGIRRCFIGRAMRNGFDRDSAEDSFQQVALIALKEISRGTVFPDMVSLRRWAYTVHRNYCIDASRRSKAVSLGEYDPEMPTDFIDELTKGEDVKALTDAVQKLPEIYREAIEGVLRGQSYQEIAVESDLDKNVSTTSVRIHRAKGILRGKLEKTVA